ncbi:type I methionyl aminopeptidase [Bacillus norwichensis]|uniref:Methionine aminopeptidase n=1 Tax=Bacillus norwichensis TaxID=2762217 RepID=A0ABR8VRR0_9BACI|nr:type I methionyl aminopeptidase [Bacillus norwichensis]MBD8007438.1 type I methionyl aminopeptidase [Bacillus norwichensis]
MVASSQKDLQGIIEAGKVISEIRDEMIANTKPGVTTKELDEIAEQMFKKYGAESAPLKTFNFPGYTCISVNEEVAHGIPGKREIRDGDIVNIDVSGSYKGYYVDTGRSFLVGEGSSEISELLDVTEHVFNEGLKRFKAGAKMNMVGRSVHRAAKQSGYTVIKNLTGHGVGSSLRDAPDHIFSYYLPWDNDLFKNGMVIAFEPFVSTVDEEVYEKEDGWTLVTKKGGYVAQIEHTIIITKDEPIVVT